MKRNTRQQAKVRKEYYEETENDDEMYPVHIATVKALVRASAKFRQISVKFR